ncbi:MAG: cob(I)yrinic acid a,c-diamide adenosyltransferase [Magnetococcales bacterium]|nr:cob(I)yrinic acid a,c-diamide adenosyltransferase [Magnetococcales bacterium]MBF0156905.1 cob(I)yrinic acid a,c-diamide adenosyltransferase [Magnetococcales bacterium]
MNEQDPKGRVLVLTGNGKGKSSSAFGMVLRASGWGYGVCVIQFIKGKWRTGEERAAVRLGNVEWHAMGDGFTWDTNNPEQDQATSREIWRVCREKMGSGQYRLVVFDEINVAMSYGWLSGDEVARAIREEKPEATHVILTGRGPVPPEVIAVADTVTTMEEVKHAFRSGGRAVKGIEF